MIEKFVFCRTPLKTRHFMHVKRAQSDRFLAGDVNERTQNFVPASLGCSSVFQRMKYIEVNCIE